MTIINTGFLLLFAVSRALSISDSLLETRKMINEILAEHTHRTLEEIDKATSYDNYFNAEEAVAFGFADGICDFKVLVEESLGWLFRAF